MNFIKTKIFPLIASHLNTATLLRYADTKLIFPFYHTVSDKYLPHIHPLYRPKTVNEFIDDLNFMIKYFEPVDINTVYSYCCQKKEIKRPSFHLTFDDGLREIYDIVTPILYKKGIPCSVFVNTDFVDNKKIFFRHKEALESQSINPDLFLAKKQPYLSTAQLASMQTNGVYIGAHSKNHPLYSSIQEEEQISQTIDSCRFIKETFKQDINIFAFPFTDSGISDSFFEQICNSVDLTFGISGISFLRNNQHIGRIDMEKYGSNAKECINKALLKKIFKANR